MTVTTSSNKVQALGNGVTTSFPYSFRIYSASDLVVTRTAIATGVDTTLTLNTDYTVTGVGSYNGGNVVTTAAPADGTRITIRRVLSATQGADLRNQGAYFAETHEDVLDRLTMVDQQQQEEIDRALSFPASEGDDTLGSIPSASQRANNLLGFDENGRPVAVAPAAQSASALQALLAASGGAGMVGFLQAGTGAVPRSVESKLRDIVSVDDFGAVGDGVTDDAPKFQLAINALNAAGGGLVNYTKRHLIDTALTIKDSVSLMGPLAAPDELLPGTSADYDSKLGTLIINSSVTVTVQDAASVSNSMVVRKGLDLPFADATAATAGVAAFAGTAFTVGGAGASFASMLILGFALAISSNGYERIGCEYVEGDCTSGLDIRNCADISYINKCHFWPWTTAHQTWTTNALLRRSGSAYLFANVGDWNKVTDCFSYGYLRGFRAASVNSMTFLSCGADNTSTAGVGDHTGAIGFSVEGSSNDTRLIGCQTAAQTNGYVFTNTAGLHSRMIGCDSWACSSNGVVVTSGDVEIQGGVQRNTVTGVNINNGSSRVFIDGVRFSALSGKPVGFGVSNPNVFLGPNNDYSDLAAGATVVSVPGNWPIHTAASADPLNLPVNCEDLQVTGTTNFGSLAGGWRGREVTLYFSGVLTVTSSAGGATTNMRLNSNANFTTAAGSALKLRHNGTQWHEVGRSA